MIRRLRWRLEDWWHAWFDTLERWYHNLYGCRRGKHLMKMGGCMYCGAGGSRQVKFYI